MTMPRPTGVLLAVAGVLLVAVSVVGTLLYVKETGSSTGSGSAAGHRTVTATKVGQPAPPTGAAIPPPPTAKATPPSTTESAPTATIKSVTTPHDAELTAALGTEVDANCGGLDQVLSAGWDTHGWLLVCASGAGARIASTIGGTYVTAPATITGTNDCTFGVHFPDEELSITPTAVHISRAQAPAKDMTFAHGVCRLGAPTKG